MWRWPCTKYTDIYTAKSIIIYGWEYQLIGVYVILFWTPPLALSCQDKHGGLKEVDLGMLVWIAWKGGLKQQQYWASLAWNGRNQAVILTPWVLGRIVSIYWLLCQGACECETLLYIMVVSRQVWDKVLESRDMWYFETTRCYGEMKMIRSDLINLSGDRGLPLDTVYYLTCSFILLRIILLSFVGNKS